MNIYDIAAEAGVSISTVSRVMNKKGNVNPEMKRRIEEVLKKYDYKPSAIARGMVSKTMKTIAILTVDLRVPQHARQVYIIEREFIQKGYNVMVCNTEGKLEECARYINLLMEKQVDGVVLIGSTFNQLKNRAEITGKVSRIPVVMANGHLDLPNFHSILIDDLKGFRNAADFLYEKGHREIFCLCDLETDSGQEKKKGFLESMKLHDIEDGESRIIACRYGMEGGTLAVEKLLELGRPFTALVVGEDSAGIGAMKELKRRGIKVPEDVAIVGYDNSPDTVVCEPELTTVDIKTEVMGTLCARTLQDLLENRGVSTSLAIQPEIIVRNST